MNKIINQLMVRILVTGSDGRFGKVLKKTNHKNIIFRNKRELNILSTKSISKNLKKYKPKYLLHLAGLSRPMSIHDKDIITKTQIGYEEEIDKLPSSLRKEFNLLEYDGADLSRDEGSYQPLFDKVPLGKTLGFSK